MYRFYNRNQLYKKVWEHPLQKLAEEFNLKPQELKKICNKLEIPTPKVGYWAKKAFGKEEKLLKFSNYKIEIEHISTQKIREPTIENKVAKNIILWRSNL